MKAKVWLIGWLAVVVTTLGAAGYWVYRVDPFFHYHKPDLDRYYYVLDNSRSQNDGISRHFDYDALITGTSMVQNFRTTEADRIFGFHSVKVGYSGASYKEINDNLERALTANRNLKTVIRSLDMMSFLNRQDAMRQDLGQYPTYLYDDNPLNDVEYLLNRDVLFSRVLLMIRDRRKEDFKPGITSFDAYCRWQDQYQFGFNTVCPDGVIGGDAEQSHLSEEERKTIRENITQNVTAVADAYPDVDFYCFYPPYSVVYWNTWKTKGVLYKQLEAEAYVTELVLPHKNIHLFSFNNRTDITADLNNYKDGVHYGCWVDSLMLKWMHDGDYQLTEANYRDYLRQEYDFYTAFDYSGVNGQEDYEADFYAAALLNRELTGVEPLAVLGGKDVDAPLRDAEFQVNLDEGYNYLAFHGRKVSGHGRLTACVYNSEGELVGKVESDDRGLNDRDHQYVVDLSAADGVVTVVLNGSADSECRFSDVYMY